VLRVLVDQGVVSAEQAEAAAKKPIGVAEPGRKGGGFYPAFLDLVRRQLRRDYQESDLTEAGLTVFSTLDPLVQQTAEDALAGELDRLDASSREAAHGLEGVVVVTTPQTGEVAALIGGRRAGFDGFNRALDAKRPIGSLAKPLVYLAALETGRYTAASILADEPIDLKLPNGDRWKPANFDRQFRGPVPMVRALTQSLNLPTVGLGLEVGLGRVAKTFEELGLPEAPPELPSMLLGATNLSPLDVAQMYNTLANGGFRSPLRAVRAVVDEDGTPLRAPELEVAAAASQEAIYVLDAMLVEVMGRGTGRAARRQLPPSLVVAGKTGTSNDYRDSWFAGFDEAHLVVVWVGADDNTPTGLTGATGALRVWDAVMAHLSVHPLSLPTADDLRTIEYATGLLANESCAEVVAVPVPADAALQSKPGCGINLRSLGDRLRGWLGRD